MKKKPTVVLRADGNSTMGLGHVFRLLAFAEILKSEYKCIFAIRNPTNSLVKQINQFCAGNILSLPLVAENDMEAEWLVDNYLQGGEIVILDGYHFKTTYQQILKDNGCKVICIDDIHAYHFVADAVINHAGGVTTGYYSIGDDTKLYLGLSYALLRKEFRTAFENRQYENRENAMLICLGGADPNNDTLNVLRECEKRGFVKKYCIIIGGAYRYRKELEEYVVTLDKEIELLSNLNAKEMTYYMKKCAKAITSPSTISYEYLSIGGELYLKVIADNQIDINRYFIDSGLAFDFRDYPILNEDRVGKSLDLQRQLLDGKSNERLIQVVKSLHE